MKTLPVRALGALAALSVLPAAAAAQQGGWPTLRDLGLEYVSRSGGVQVSLSGQLDVEAMHTSNSWSSLVSLEGGTDVLESIPEDCSVCHGDEPLTSKGGGLAAHRLRLFVDVFLGDHVYGLVEARADRGESPTTGKGRVRLEQAYLRLQTASGMWGLQVGRFAPPVGSYPMRHLSVDDPFVRPPLAYDYRTLMNRTVAPGDVQALLNWRNDPESFRRTGAPPVWAVPYQWGAMAMGRVAGIDVRAAVVNSAPSSAPDAWALEGDRFDEPTRVLSAHTSPHPDLRVGVSWSRGPWMETLTSGEVRPDRSPPGTSSDLTSFHQELLTADLTWARGATTVRAEAMLDRWAVPNVPVRPAEVLYTVEVIHDVAAGLTLAGRAGYIDFRPVVADDPADAGIDWDHDVARYEGSVAYRLTRNAGLVLSAYQQVQSGAADTDGRFVGLRLWWGF